jgi:hypothetical protein
MKYDVRFIIPLITMYRKNIEIILLRHKHEKERRPSTGKRSLPSTQVGVEESLVGMLRASYRE